MTTSQKIIKYIAAGFALFLAVSIVASILTIAASLIGNLAGWDASTISDEQDFSAQLIQSIDIDLPSGELIIQPGDRFHVSAKNVPDSYTCQVENGTLKLKSKGFLFSSFINFGKGAKVIVTIPSDYAFESISIDLGVGEINLEKVIAAKNCEIDLGCGEISLTDVTLHNVSADLGIGEIELKGVISGENVFDNGIGDIDLTIYANPKNYNVDTDKGIGAASVSDKTNNRYTDVIPEKHSITASLGIGDIDITFK